MPSSAASNAGRRWGAVAITTTLASPIFERAQPVHHGDTADGEFGGDRCADFRHFPDCHSFVAFVIETKGRPASGIVTDHTLKSYTGAVQTLQEAVFEGSEVDRAARQGEIMACWVGYFMERLAVGTAAYRR